MVVISLYRKMYEKRGVGTGPDISIEECINEIVAVMVLAWVDGTESD